MNKYLLKHMGVIGDNTIYYVDKSGLYRLFWNLSLEGVSDQEEASVLIDSSNELFSFSYPNIQYLKKKNGNLVLRGETAVEVDAGDTVKVSIQIDSSKNSKSVSLSSGSISLSKLED